MRCEPPIFPASAQTNFTLQVLHHLQLYGPLLHRNSNHFLNINDYGSNFLISILLLIRFQILGFVFKLCRKSGEF